MPYRYCPNRHSICDHEDTELGPCFAQLWRAWRETERIGCPIPVDIATIFVRHITLEEAEAAYRARWPWSPSLRVLRKNGGR
jgi:hypothetical protein